jgi:hypothetical protein
MWNIYNISKRTIFWDVTSCSPVDVNRRFWRGVLPASSGSKCKSSNKKFLLLAACSFNTLVNTYSITQCNIPKDSTLQSHGCENIEFHMQKFCWKSERLISFGRPRYRWRTALKGTLDNRTREVDWIYLVEGKDQWRALVNKTHVWVQYRENNFLTDCAITNFSRGTLFHGVGLVCVVSHEGHLAQVLTVHYCFGTWQLQCTHRSLCEYMTVNKRINIQCSNLPVLTINFTMNKNNSVFVP